MTKLFFCYSKRLHRALIANGFNPVFIGYTLKSGQLVYIYEGTQSLNDYKNNIYQLERDKF